MTINILEQIMESDNKEISCQLIWSTKNIFFRTIYWTILEKSNQLQLMLNTKFQFVKNDDKYIRTNNGK